MRGWMRGVVVGLLAVLMLTACAPPPAGRTSGAQSQEAPRPATPKRITAVIRDVPPSFVTRRTRPDGFRGLDALEEMAHAGLTLMKADGTRAPQLAESVPTIESGLWRLFPDGRMETTWKIKPTARWHDGTPLTADDLLFAAMIEQDKELEISFAAYELVESVAAPDPRTITVTWKRPYIEADWMFSYRGAGLPLPKHILEKPYATDKANFLGLPYWSQEFVGAGAYRVQEWAQDTHVILRAYDDYILGRPKIDDIEVKFIQDNNTLIANVLAGIDLTLGKTVSLDIALQARDQWKDGKVISVLQNWTPINPQWINPDPPIIANYQFRRALIMALDRQELADVVFSGQGAVAHSYVSPETPLYNLVEPAIVKYAYDPRQSAQILEGLGYTKRADGFLYDAEGRKLVVDIQIPLQNDVHPKTAAPVADRWQQLGVGVDQTPIPIQRAQDREWRAQFPGFNIVERVNNLAISEIWRFHSSQVPLAENRWLAGGFASRYRSPVVDAALERYVTTIPLPERMDAVATLVHHQTENLTELPIFYGADPTLISNRLVNVSGRGPLYTQAWNAHEWDLRN
jgi:peptide/nickel transport system substrate-binding protein